MASFIDHSGSVKSGGVSQIMIPAGQRLALVIENPVTATSQGIVTAESLFINFTNPASTTVAGSIELIAGGSHTEDTANVTFEAVTVTAATTAHQFTAKELVP